MRSFVRVAGRAKLSTAVLFIDVKSAFHCMLREVVFGTQDRFPQQLRRVLDEEGFNVADLESAITKHSADFVSTATINQPGTLCRDMRYATTRLVDHGQGVRWRT